MLKLTHPEKNMPIFIDADMIVAIEPNIYKDWQPMTDEQIEALSDEEVQRVEEMSKKAGYEEPVFEMARPEFGGTTIYLTEKIEICVKEKPGIVERKMRKEKERARREWDDQWKKERADRREEFKKDKELGMEE